MKPAPFTYHAPTTTAEAVGLLGRLENARALAGGQSLMPMMNFRFVMPDHLVDLNAIAELADMHIEPGRIVFGAMTRQRAIEQSPDIQAACPILNAALQHVGHRQTRNRGTIGGSLCHLDPSAELVNIACLHDAQFTARSGKGERTLPFAEFAQGYLTTGLNEDELLTSVALQRWDVAHGFGFEEVARRRGDFAIAMVAVLLALDGKEAISRAAICISGVEPIPVRLSAVEQALAGAKPDADAFRAAGAEAEKLEAMEDAYVSARYRKHLARVLVVRALEKAATQARARGSAHA